MLTYGEATGPMPPVLLWIVLIVGGAWLLFQLAKYAWDEGWIQETAIAVIVFAGLVLAFWLVAVLGKAMHS